MKARKITKRKTSDDSQATDDTDPSFEKIKTGKATWMDVLPFFNSFPYFIAFYFCWYFMNHNVLPVLFLIY